MLLPAFLVRPTTAGNKTSTVATFRPAIAAKVFSILLAHFSVLIPLLPSYARAHFYPFDFSLKCCFLGVFCCCFFCQKMTSLPSTLQDARPCHQGNLNQLSLGQSLHFLTRMTFRTWTSALGARGLCTVIWLVIPHPSSAARCAGASPGEGEVLSFSPPSPLQQGSSSCWPIRRDQQSEQGTTGSRREGCEPVPSSNSHWRMSTFEATACFWVATHYISSTLLYFWMPKYTF